MIIGAYLDATGLTQEALALLINRDQGTISKIIRGQRKRYTIEDLEAVRDGLHAPGHIFGLLPGTHEPSSQTMRPRSTTTTASLTDGADGVLTGSLVNTSGSTPIEDENVERRQLLQLAALGLSTSALGLSGEPVRQLFSLQTESEHRDLNGWHLTLSDHLHAIRTRPAGQVRDGLLIDLAALQRQRQTAQPSIAVELHRITAGLATLLGNVLTRLGDHGAAIRWWRTARSAADASGDLDLRLMVRAEEARFGLYGQRAPDSILQLLDHAEHLAGDASSTQSFWVADFAGTRAKALALLGRNSESVEALSGFVSSAADAKRASGGLLPELWKEDQVHFAESWVYAHAGEDARAGRARDKVLALTGDYQYIANVRLHEALCTTVNGGIVSGARQASEVLDAIPATDRTRMVTETARRVLYSIPPRHHDDPAVRNLRELTASAPHIG